VSTRREQPKEDTEEAREVTAFVQEPIKTIEGLHADVFVFFAVLSIAVTLN
jgi:hypothetical protein